MREIKRDILFKTEDFIFSYRAGGIPVRDGKVLLQTVNGEFFTVVGGHVNAMEDSAAALKREFYEELNAEIEVKNMVAAAEIYLPWDTRPGHQICFYYRIDILSDGNIPSEGEFRGDDELDGQIFKLRYLWVPIENLGKTAMLYPPQLTDIIKSGTNELTHFVYDEIEDLKHK